MEMRIIQHFAALFIVVSLFVSNSAGDDSTYAIYIPGNLRANFPIEFVVEILQSPNPVEFSATLATPAKEIDFSLTAVLNEGESKILKFDDMIPYGYDGTVDFTMTVEGVDSVTKEILFKNSTTELRFNTKALSIFIQTDKAIYQPSQTVKFRAVVTTAELLPYLGTVTYKLTDPDSNIIVQEKNSQLTNGVVGSEFTLSKYSTLGEWKISYEVLGYEEFLIVTVEEYKLPKFEMELNLDRPFLYPESAGLSGKISAKFTFGQPVKGVAKIQFDILPTWNCFLGPCQPISFTSFGETYPDFDGEIEFNFPLSRFKDHFEYTPGEDYRRITVTAFVKDKHSLVELNETATVASVKYNMKSEIVLTPETIKPGLPYKAYVKLTEYDGRLLPETTRESLEASVQIQYMLPYDHRVGYVKPKTELQAVSVREDGMIEFSMIASTENFDTASFGIKLEGYGEEYHVFSSWSASRFNSPSNIYIQISSEKDEYKDDETAVMTIRTTKKADAYNFLVLSRGKVVERKTYSPESYVEEDTNFRFNYEIKVTRNMFPSVSVFVSFMESGGEIVADTMSFNVKAALGNEVTIVTSTSESDTGLPVDITVTTSPNSFIGLRAIDRSVLLLKEGNDITMDKIFNDLNKYRTSYDSYPSYYRWASGSENAKDLFQKGGLLVITDAAIFLNQTSQTRNVYFAYEFDDGLEVMENAVAAVDFAQDDMNVQLKEGAGDTVQQAAPAPKVRKEFPETWIWEETNSGESGSKTLSYVLPDSTTTWEISGFAVSDVTGLGVTEQNAQIVASRNFFISLDLPATMISGETLTMRTTVYNFYSQDLEVMLKLEETEWYKFILIGNDTTIAGSVRRMIVPSQDGITVIFPIKFVKPGLARVKVTALSDIAGDAIERTIPVKPEGIANEMSISTLIERNSVNAEATVVKLPVIIPTNAVEGSVYVRLSASGDIMGNALNNVGNLLRLPSGCGEQTMLSFAPDVYISLYLQKVDLLTGGLERKSKSHIRAGYQNELRYQHEDGSFSAFVRDPEGSTWLTSFVVKCFIAATQLDEGLVEKAKIDAAINFLLKKQAVDGSFTEEGLVRHKDMQGGVNNVETITAYTIVALAEREYYKDKGEVSKAINKGKYFLEIRAENIDDTFSLAIIAYALALSESPVAADVMFRLKERAVIENNLKYWVDENSAKLQCSTSDWTCYSKATSSDIEITSYIFLTLMKMNDEENFMPIVRWLIEQRSAFGGYDSTQDTVMAIQALATFAGRFSKVEKDLTLDITHSANDSFNAPLQIDEDNSIVLQSVELPSISGNVSVAATGIGIADVQLATTYHLPPGAQADEPFIMTWEISEQDNGDMQLQICAKVNEGRDKPIESTGMYIIVIELLSGYSVNIDDAIAQNENAKLVELVGNELTGYFDKLVKGDNKCLFITEVRYAKISGLKDRMIKALDYYKPEEMSLRLYSPPHDEESDLCKTCPECKGCPSSDAVQKTVSVFSILLSLVTMVMFLQF